jgi:hypothetical protein
MVREKFFFFRVSLKFAFGCALPILGKTKTTPCGGGSCRSGCHVYVISVIRNPLRVPIFQSTIFVKNEL